MRCNDRHDTARAYDQSPSAGLLNRVFFFFANILHCFINKRFAAQATADRTFESFLRFR